jgi:hypothetical protein
MSFKNMKSKSKKLLALVSVTAVSAVSTSAMAALDTTAIEAAATAFQGDAVAVAGVIGLAFMAAAFAFVIYKWIRGAIFS